MTINQMDSSQNVKSIIHIPIDHGFSCIRGLSPKKLRFEIEFSLGKGTTSNTFIFHEENSYKNNNKNVLVNPPGANFEEVFLPQLQKIITNHSEELLIIIGHINPNRIKLIKSITAEFSNIEIICSNPAGILLKELWSQTKPSPKNIAGENNSSIPPIP